MSSPGEYLPEQHNPVATIRVHAPDSIAIDQEVFASIADDPIYLDAPRRRHIRPLTFRELVGKEVCSTQHRLWLDIGWWGRVSQGLIARGWQVEVDPVRKANILGLVPNLQPDDSRWNRPPFLRRAYKRICSLAIVPSAAERSEILGELCRQYPEANLLVVVRNNRESVVVAKMLSQRTGRRFTYGDYVPVDFPRMHVDSVTGFSHGTSADWTFLVFWNAELILSRGACEQIEAMFGSVRIGFLSCDERQRNERDRAIIEGKFGPVIYRPTDVLGGTQVAVAWITPPEYPASKSQSSQSRFAQKCSLVWRNTPRNQRIADVAQALSSRDQNRIARLELTDAAAWLWSTDTLPDLGVVIVVESVDHGRALGELLPNWRLARLTPGVEDNDDNTLLGGNAIVTLACAHQGIVAANVVIYAAAYGGHWISQLGPQWQGVQGDRMLVVDVDDGFHSDIQADVVQRATDYGHRGWKQFLPSISQPTVDTRPPKTNETRRHRKRRRNRKTMSPNR